MARDDALIEEQLELLRFFDYDHLSDNLQAISKPFFDLAHQLTDDRAIEPSAELTMALRKLLESKDCAVRAAIPR